MEIWCHDFEGISWENVGYTTSGMAGVYSDNFTSINHVDLLGTGPGGSQSFLTAPIFGDVSNNSTSYGSRGCGGCWMNVYDYDDGLEDILYNHHDLICILKGTDDTRLLNKYVGDMFGGWTENGHAYVADFRANGRCSIVYARTVPLNSEGNTIWHNPQAAVNNLRPVLGDIDGALELLQIRCWLAGDGTIKWTCLVLEG